MEKEKYVKRKTDDDEELFIQLGIKREEWVAIIDFIVTVACQNDKRNEELVRSLLHETTEYLGDS